MNTFPGTANDGRFQGASSQVRFPGASDQLCFPGTADQVNLPGEVVNLESETDMETSRPVVNVVGIVIDVKFGEKGQGMSFRLRCPDAGETYMLVSKIQYPLRSGDSAYVSYVMRGTGKMEVVKPPLARPPMDCNGVVQSLTKSLGLGFKPAMQLYYALASLAGGEEKLIKFMNDLAESWHNTKRSDLLGILRVIHPDKVKALYVWWHRERNVRPLELLGLSKREIEECRIGCNALYEKCLNNPYTIVELPLERCDGIMERLNRKINNDDRLRGSMMRVLWKHVTRNAWTCTPTWLWGKQFPELRYHIQAMKKDYGLVIDMETSYLKYPYEIEKWIAEYIITQRKADPITYDTPIGETNTGSIRKPAVFTKELSEDQKQAVQGVLDHKISILTGGPGTGKCLLSGTDILMYNGEIKKVETIKQGDVLMGPDSTPRTVLSICSNIDDMYEIRPHQGRPFVCNAPHVLTLIESKIPPGRIFDIPLNEYQSLTPERRNVLFLFHVGVDFPQRFVPSDPYLIGYQLIKKDLHIPDIYKINSRHIRLQVLAGLIDAAGLVYDDCIELTLNNVTLAKDIEYIAFSIGFMVTQTQCSNDGASIEVHIFGDNLDTIPLLLSRKKSGTRFPHRITKYVQFDVRYWGKGRYHGFELDGDGRFLLGDFLVTHNTTCISQIVHNLELRGILYAICAFVGKAVARIREVTKKRNPATIHRLIHNTKRCKKTEYMDMTGKKKSQFDKDIPDSEYEHIIIDEASMVTTELLYDFLRAYPGVKKLTLVGDVNQLAPIKWGNLFQQLLKSETVPVYRLTTNYRVYTANGEMDGIIMNANMLVTHDMEFPFEFIPTNNFTVMEGGVDKVYGIIQGCFGAGVNSDQLVVLSPYKSYLPEINKEFQDIYDLGARYVKDYKGVKWMINDRVMLKVNDADIGVFNGETGVIRDVSSKAILVDFGPSGRHEFIVQLQMQETPPNKTHDTLSTNENDETSDDPTNPDEDSITSNEENEETDDSGENEDTEPDEEKSIVQHYKYPGNKKKQINKKKTGNKEKATNKKKRIAKRSNKKKKRELYEDYLVEEEYYGEDDDHSPGALSAKPIVRTTEQLVHASALTIDKSQGSEWDYVILFVAELNMGAFINKNRIYTGITRTKKAIWLVVPDIDLFNIAAIKPPSRRYENLSRRLTDSLNKMPPSSIKTANSYDGIPQEDLEIPPDALDECYDCDDYD